MKAMNVLKRIVTGLGGILALAMLLQLAAPRAVHAVVSALVTVANTGANPVPTQRADNPARTAVELHTSGDPITGAINIQPGDYYSGEYLIEGVQGVAPQYVVPAGHRLVVESISGRIELPIGEAPTFVEVEVAFGEINSIIDLVPSFVASTGSTYVYAFATQITTYADPATSVQAFCGRTSTTGSATCTVALSGHLESIE